MSYGHDGACSDVSTPLRLGYAVLHMPHIMGRVLPVLSKSVSMMVIPSTTDFPLCGHKPHDAVFSYSDFPNNCQKSGCMMLLCTEPIFFERMMHF